MSAVQAIILVALANDYGFGSDVPLRFAEADAVRMTETISELSGGAQVHAAIGGDAHAAQVALENAAQDVASAKSRGERSLLIFYYSGHADGDFLRTGNTRMTWSKLRSLIQGTGADLTLAIIDACDSGSAITQKGGSFAPPFSTRTIEPIASKGSMWISSSRSDEASYESDELGGSFFSHFLVSGLRGAADVDEDGRVTLAEAYQFTFDRTVGETSLKLKRTQHPTYRSELAGEGEIVISEPKRSTTSLVLPREASGAWFFARRFGSRQSVLEVPKTPGTLVRMSVPAGAYLVYKKEPDRLLLTEVFLHANEEVVLDPNALKPHAYADVLEKGGGIAVGAWSARAGLAYASPLVDGAEHGVELRAGVLRRGRMFGAGVNLSAARFDFDAVDTRVENHALSGQLFGEIFFDLDLGTLALEAGPAAIFLVQKTDRRLHRSLSPGLAAAVTWERSLFGGVGFAVELGTRAFLFDGAANRTIAFSAFGTAALSVRIE